MKARLIRDTSRPNPAYDKRAAHEARKAGQKYSVPQETPVPKGTEIDHPDAWWLVKMGMALPLDAECGERAGMTDDQIQAAILAQDRMANEDLAATEEDEPEADDDESDA